MAPFSFATLQENVQALFPDDILIKFHTSHRFFGPVCEAAAETFHQTVTASADSGKKLLRVLEVGASNLFPPWAEEEIRTQANTSPGNGLPTRALCSVLERRDDVIVEYVVSGLSFALANATVSSYRISTPFRKPMTCTVPSRNKVYYLCARLMWS